MAEALDDGVFWLPSEFLTDDDILMEKHKFQNKMNTQSESKFCFPSEFPYGFYNSSSPVESLVGSTETESDEEDYLAGFTRQMARSLLQQAELKSSSVFGTDNPKTKVMAGSPQSPLCGLGSWSGCSSGSSRGSPNGPSQVSSPPSTPFSSGDDALDLLYAAAGQVVRMKLNDETSYGRGLLGVPQKKPNSIPVPVGKKSNVGFYSNEALIQQQLQANHFYQLNLKHQQQQQCSAAWGRQTKSTQNVPQQQQQVPSAGRRAGLGNGRCSRPLGLPPSAWPPLQQQNQNQNGSGMRAVFLNGSGARRESSGTGVFIPLRNGIASESRKKPSCSAALLPARVVQALNLNFDEMGLSGPQTRYVGGFGHGNALLSQHQSRSYRSHQPAMINTEVQLPQEWTY
ncbi:3-phosphoshikimate 1-carboxyvinyltransferase [Thalictrum thalictroides]|uniref:3-phosphoshikimate 1-carboxyvinyltransferase n=1 Tax=Thalictrum thalictroides TaxID=46969 RepID=A0A7J6UWC1_THATH|nr:3-phosphoshikimate 1-carboxyvinyltransferase [Thalictrum thalictroides]